MTRTKHAKVMRCCRKKIDLSTRWQRPSPKHMFPNGIREGVRSLALISHSHSPMLNETNCTHAGAYAHPVASVKQMCTLMFTTSV